MLKSRKFPENIYETVQRNNKPNINILFDSCSKFFQSSYVSYCFYVTIKLKTVLESSFWILSFYYLLCTGYLEKMITNGHISSVCWQDGSFPQDYNLSQKESIYWRDNSSNHYFFYRDNLCMTFNVDDIALFHVIKTAQSKNSFTYSSHKLFQNARYPNIYLKW